MNKKLVYTLAGLALLVPLIAAIFLMPAKTNAPSSSRATDENNAPAKTERTVTENESRPAEASADTNTNRQVDIADFMFTPQTITVKAGDTVRWTNKDRVDHTVTAVQLSKDAPDSEYFGYNESYSYTFKKAGTYDYFCEPHPQMRGTVVVTE